MDETGTDYSRLLRERIQAAKKEIPSDLVLKNGWVINVFTGEIYEADIAVHGGIIVGIGKGYEGKTETDVMGKWVAPGLIDGHLHIESSMLVPSTLAPELMVHGTTTIVSDPHEIANVCGLDGIKFMIEDSRYIPLDIFFMAPSCVPSTDLETSGAVLDSSVLSALMSEQRVIGLAEMMNFPGVLAGDEEVLNKIALFKDRIIDGHCPGLSGSDLQAYVAAGICSDHESTERLEGLNKIRNGIMLMIREGTSAKNLEDLIPLVTPGNYHSFCLVSDDLHPFDIKRGGHLDHTLKKAVSLGLDPVTALRLVTITPSEFFGFKDRGALAPGYCADMVLFDDLENFHVDKVYKRGVLVAENGRPVYREESRIPAMEGRIRATFHMAPFTKEDLRIIHKGGKLRVIEVIPGQITTNSIVAEPKVRKGCVISDPSLDILKICVVERHRATGNVGLGLVRGFGLKDGAIASSVAHDSHNVIAVGVRDEDMVLAVNSLKEMGGGQVVVCSGQVMAYIALDVAGLMTSAPMDELLVGLESLKDSVSQLGCTLEDPFMALSFLALPVIPHLKITDMGLVDVDKFELVDLWMETR